MRTGNGAAPARDDPGGLGPRFQAEVLARRYYELFNERRLNDAERLVDAQAVFTSPIAREHLIGPAGYRELVRRWIDAFPDARVRIEHAIVSDDLVVTADLLMLGTHRGPLNLPGLSPMPPTGRELQLPMRGTTAIENGLVVNCVVEFELAALRRALRL